MLADKTDEKIACVQTIVVLTATEAYASDSSHKDICTPSIRPAVIPSSIPFSVMPGLFLSLRLGLRAKGVNSKAEMVILQKLAADPGTPDNTAITDADETAVTAVESINSL